MLFLNLPRHELSCAKGCNNSYYKNEPVRSTRLPADLLCRSALLSGLFRHGRLAKFFGYLIHSRMPTQRRSSRRGGKQDSTAATEVKQEDEISSYEKARVSRTQQPSLIFFFMTLSSFLYSMRRERIALRCIFIFRFFQNAYCAQRCRHRLLLNKACEHGKKCRSHERLGFAGGEPRPEAKEAGGCRTSAETETGRRCPCATGEWDLVCSVFSLCSSGGTYVRCTCVLLTRCHVSSNSIGGEWRGAVSGYRSSCRWRGGSELYLLTSMFI